MEIMQQPQNPDDISRQAGRDLYGTPVGILRRAELYRLGNAWGFEFPVGASKDFMLPFFMQLEADGKNPLKPPGGTLDQICKAREVKFNGETHAEREEDPYGLIKPEETSKFEAGLQALHMSKIRKICKLRGIPQTIRDRKQDLIARIVDTSGGNSFGDDITDGG